MKMSSLKSGPAGHVNVMTDHGYSIGTIFPADEQYGAWESIGYHI